MPPRPTSVTSLSNKFAGELALTSQFSAVPVDGQWGMSPPRGKQDDGAKDLASTPDQATSCWHPLLTASADLCTEKSHQQLAPHGRPAANGEDPLLADDLPRRPGARAGIAGFDAARLFDLNHAPSPIVVLPPPVTTATTPRPDWRQISRACTCHVRRLTGSADELTVTTDCCKGHAGMTKQQSRRGTPSVRHRHLSAARSQTSIATYDLGWQLCSTAGGASAGQTLRHTWIWPWGRGNSSISVSPRIMQRVRADLMRLVHKAHSREALMF